MKNIKKINTLFRLSLQSSKTISSEDKNFNNRNKRENFEEIQAIVNEFDPLEEIEQELHSNLIQNMEFQNANTLENLSNRDDENIDIEIPDDKFPKPEIFKLHISDGKKKLTEVEHKSVVIEKGDMNSIISQSKPDPEKNLTENQKKMDQY